MKRRIAEPQSGVREHEFVAEPISMFAKISLTKLGSLGDRESESKKGGKNPQALKTNKQKAMTKKLKQQRKKTDASGRCFRGGALCGVWSQGSPFPHHFGVPASL